jgi:hypothetical protein
MGNRIKARWKKVILTIAVALVSVWLLGIASMLWRYNTWYPAIPWAKFTINGHPASNLSLYHQINGEAIIAVAEKKGKREIYFVNPAHDEVLSGELNVPSVTPCRESGVFITRLFAVQNHEQLCWPLFVPTEGQETDKQKQIDRGSIRRDRSMEFNADDGTRRSKRRGKPPHHPQVIH